MHALTTHSTYQLAETNGDWVRIELTPNGPGGWVQRRDRRREYLESIADSASAAVAWQQQTSTPTAAPQRPKLKTNSSFSVSHSSFSVTQDSLSLLHLRGLPSPALA